MSYGADHCSKVYVCGTKEVTRNRDAIVEAHGRNQLDRATSESVGAPGGI
jgi:hypothetical protein